MNLLVIGSGGREHALAWKAKKSPLTDKIYAAPGNPGTARIAENVNIAPDEQDRLVRFCQKNEIDLVFVGPEKPLVQGLCDVLRQNGLAAVGPGREGARLEGSKVFAKDFMARHGIPTANYEVFSRPRRARDYIADAGAPIVVKADGLAAGKGVYVCDTEPEALAAVEEIMVEKRFGQAGEKIVIEELLKGEEASILAFTDGEDYITLTPSQDHKPAYDNDRGPNTGGMGAVAPTPVAEGDVRKKVRRKILNPTMEGLKEDGIDFSGLLYCGLMVSASGEPYVLEYNVRFGDPEAQVVLPLLKTDLIELGQAAAQKRLNEIEVKWSEKTAACVVMASEGYPLDYETGREISGIERAITSYRTVFHAATAEKDGKLVTDGGRVLGVTAVAEKHEDAIERAYAGVDKIDFAGAHYRTDIGQKALHSLTAK